MLGNGLLCLWRSRRSRGGCCVGDIEWNARTFCSQRQTRNEWIHTTTQVTWFLFRSSFALEVVFIFVSSVTGTVLLSHGEGSSKMGYTSPLGLLRHHHEFEYLTMCASFLQGLFHWLAAVGLEIIIPKPNAGLGSKWMNSAWQLASWRPVFGYWPFTTTTWHITETPLEW